MTGFICLNKPGGITSFSAVAKVRKIVGEKKAGHCGTLDPMATGVLPIMLGGATRFLEFLPDSNKKYQAVMKLGLTSDTLDITGNILTTEDVNVSFDDVREAALRYVGDIMQIPPMYSAVKKDGVKMYELARKGIEVERQPRQVTIYSLKVSKGASKDEYILDIECSSGTYIRTLIDDIGKDLGCGALMSSLNRTFATGFDIDRSVTLEELESDFDKTRHLISVEEALNAYPKAFVSDGQAVRFANGGSLDLEKIESCKARGLYRIYSHKNEFIGLGEASPENGKLLFRRVYNER